MDILTHTLSGLAVGTAIAAQQRSYKAILLGGLGAALPDFDAISLWSKFDGTIGKFLGLAHSGHDIYFGKYWYSHHAFLHSFFGAFLMGLLIFWLAKLKKSKHAFQYGLAVFLGFTMHLLGDMPTPASIWGGVNFWWPSTQYLGGFGHIWWWNNYDIFLIALTAVCINLVVLTMANFINNKWLQKIVITVFLLGIVLSVFQIKTRNYDFNYEGFSTDFGTKEEKSLEIQHEILGDKLYNAMRILDGKVKLHF